MWGEIANSNGRDTSSVHMLRLQGVLAGKLLAKFRVDTSVDTPEGFLHPALPDDNSSSGEFCVAVLWLLSHSRLVSSGHTILAINYGQSPVPRTLIQLPNDHFSNE